MYPDVGVTARFLPILLRLDLFNISLPLTSPIPRLEGILDEIRENLPPSRGQNGYTLGRIETHSIIVAVMPAIGNNRAIDQVRAVSGDRGRSTGRGGR